MNDLIFSSHTKAIHNTFVSHIEFFVIIVWPQGTYALPKAVSGCPLNWQEGWIHQDLENESPKTEFSHGLQSHMSASLSGGDVKRSFCVKTVSQIEERSWPPGKFNEY